MELITLPDIFMQLCCNFIYFFVYTHYISIFIIYWLDSYKCSCALVHWLQLVISYYVVIFSINMWRKRAWKWLLP